MKIQRRFLWGGVKGGCNITWVRWFDVCKPKKIGGLGVWDLRLFILALLGKWRRCFLLGDLGVWRDIMSSIY